MKSGGRIKIGLCVLLAFVYGCSGSLAKPRDGNGWNVIIILVDAMRFDHLGCYGYKKNTSPNMDRISQEGLVFENAISQGASTKAAVAAMFTSRYLKRFDSKPINYALPSSALTLAEVLLAHGYTTQGIYDNGMVHKGTGFEQGFEGYTAVGPDRDKTSYALNWIERNSQKKFFMYIHYMAPHADYDPPEGYKEKFRSGYNGKIDFKGKHQEFFNGTVLSAEDVTELRARYDGEINYIDDEVGRLEGYLREKGLLEKTVLVIMADHGEALAENGVVGHGWPLNSVVQVPLIVRLPGGHHPQRVNQVVESIDIAPSLLAQLNMAVPLSFRGVNVFDVERVKEKRAFSQAKTSWVLIRDGAFMFKTNGKDGFLYDLKADPFEHTDIAGNSPGQMKDLMSAYHAFQARRDGLEMEYRPADADTKERLKALGYLQ
ncbi:MAG: sulfatase [Candidatus Omnitrophica bacterium]|nr:sulfatase [Candidatus Omnitrophota bacterium]